MCWAALQNRRPIIGLAGGIGAGKSAVAKILAELGCVVSDSDVAARAALRDPQIKATLIKWWGDRILDSSKSGPHRGEVDRSAVAKIIFNDPAQRKRLEQLTHPWIEAKRRELFSKEPAKATAFVIDAPLLFEAGLDSECDSVIFVETSRATRLARLAASRGWNEAEMALREQSQMPLDAKRDRADYVVENNGDLGELKAQVRRVLDQIVESCRT
ncbi:MAG: dephospho-CoA kinase [Phycisphaerales bacterium]|nr:dephospho-CoA kinase [Phycisphaerales bacterium]MCI0629734.1 dephospho-CoA kinase [Phycisphaerales bacterium]MCI0677113.1 dephospho-CoA kinase [Phycisphaerales bacterium]